MESERISQQCHASNRGTRSIDEHDEINFKKHQPILLDLRDDHWPRRDTSRIRDNRTQVIKQARRDSCPDRLYNMSFHDGHQQRRKEPRGLAEDIQKDERARDATSSGRFRNVHDRIPDRESRRRND